jgi:hypothetical protein
VTPVPAAAPGRPPAAASATDAGTGRKPGPGAHVPEPRASDGRAVERGVSR